jgi:hypothetical protein
MVNEIGTVVADMARRVTPSCALVQVLGPRVLGSVGSLGRGFGLGWGLWVGLGRSGVDACLSGIHVVRSKFE